jgi:hypothetical protein
VGRDAGKLLRWLSPHIFLRKGKPQMNLAALTMGLLLSLVGLSFGQTAMTSTTLASAVAARDNSINVASATGFVARGLQTSTMIYVNREAMRVTTVDGTVIGVERGTDGTTITAHASGSKVFYGVPRAFAGNTPSGPCTATSEEYLPRIVPSTGVFWNCINSKWMAYTGSYDNVGTPNTGVTAREYGDDRRHVTQLTFTDLAIGSATGAANLAFGKLLYTLPAGAIVVKAAYMNIALSGAGSTVDADTPDGGLGTVIGSGVVAVLGGTATFEDILTGQTFNDVNATAEVKTISNQVLTIEAADAHTVHFNLADGWAGAAAVTGSGTVVLEWVLLQ